MLCVFFYLFFLSLFLCCSPDWWDGAQGRGFGQTSALELFGWGIEWTLVQTNPWTPRCHGMQSCSARSCWGCKTWACLPDRLSPRQTGAGQAKWHSRYRVVFFLSRYLFVCSNWATPNHPPPPHPPGCHVCTATPPSWLLTVNDKMYPSEGSLLDFNSSSGGIIQRNVIYSLLVSLTHDLIHLTRLPWRPLKGNKRWVR